MTMVINGSGTITGLSAGGLPDASVTATDLASGAARSNFGAGAVLQVVQGTSSTAVVNNTNTYVDTGLSATLTPSSTSSKILVISSLPYASGTNAGSVEINFQVIRDAASVFVTASVINPGAIVQLFNVAGISYLDSPNTTSAVTYKMQFKERAASNRYGGTAVMPINNTQTTGSIIILEIAG